MTQAAIIAGFPGVGKTEYVKRVEGRVTDLEPTPFKYGSNQASWLENYLAAVRKAATEFDTVFIATYPEVIRTLIAEGYQVTVVHPGKSQKDEYEKRYRTRGNHEGVVRNLVKNFETNIDNLIVLEGCRRIVLEPGQYLSAVV